MKYRSIAGVLTLVSAVAFAQATDLEIMEAYQNTLRSVSQQVLPVVVELEVVERVSRQPTNAPEPLQFFFGRPQGGEPQDYERRGIGSGILVRRDGDTVYVLTNDHVAGEADSINVRLYDEREFRATLVGSDPNRDLALLSFETSEDVPVARLGDSDSVQVGDFVLAVGNPLGFESTVTSGIVSALGRRGPRRAANPLLTDYIQTDAAINRGNSGGALVNLRGEVVGMNTWIATPSGGSIGLGFAIPINNASSAIDQFISSGTVEYGWLGVNMANPPQSPSNSLQESMGGAFVFSVYDGSPAANAAIQPGDIIYRVGSRMVRDSDDLLQAITDLSPGDRARVNLRRGGSVRTVTVEIGSRPASGEAVSADALWPGMSVVEMTNQIRSNLEMSSRDGDLIISQVAGGSPAATAGLRSGDIILRVNDDEVSTLREFYDALNNAPNGEVICRIRRNETTLIIGLVRL